MTDVLRPKGAFDEKADLLAPTTEYLKGLALLGEAPMKPGEVIEANELALTKTTEKFVQWSGITSAGVVAAGGTLWATIKSEPIALAGTAIAVAIIVAAAFYALARVLDGDVRGRAAATVAQIEARAQVSDALLRSFDRVPMPDGSVETSSGEKGDDGPDGQSIPDLVLLAAMARFQSGLKVKTGGAEYREVVGVRRLDESVLEIKRHEEDWIPASDVTDFTTD